MANHPEVVLSVKDVKKDFHLPHDKQNSIKSAIVNMFRRRDKEADTQHALRGISFDIRKGEFFGILGRNGSGKSTMLKIISEIYQPTSGTVSHKGKLVPFIELGVGFNPELTGRENVYLNGALLGFSEKEIDKRYDDIVAFAELQDFMEQKLKNYSSGMQVRLAFAVATHAEAEILVVDEVLAVGDADFQRKCYDFFKSLKKSGKTVVFVTHDMTAVREYCDRAILINEGKISASGDPNDIADEYLKLFNKSMGNKIYSEDKGRWGNGLVYISNVAANIDKDNIIIKLSLTANDSEDVEGVVFGYKLFDSEGKVALGGNTLNCKNPVHMKFTKSESKDITFTIPNILGNGTFTLSGTARLSDGVTICDDWRSMASISNTRDEGYYSIVAPAMLEVKNG